jgi:tetratricopeptide (TPR) repeat protein
MPKVNLLNAQAIGELVELVNRGLLGEAENNSRTLLMAHPNVGMLWKILSVALVRQGKDALEALRKTTELMADDAEAHRNLGAALCEQGQWALGLESFRRALALAPLDADCLVETADALRALWRAREAVPLYQRALQINPQLVEAQNNLGNAYLELAHPAEAATCFERALRSRPDDAQILCNLGNAERQLGHMDEALALARRAIVRDPSLGAAYNLLGLVLANLGQREEAAVSFRQALALNARDVEALLGLGNVLREMGQRREAVPLFEQAIQVDPGRVDTHWYLGSVLFELRRVREAAASYARALALKPDYAPAHLSMGLVLRQQRRPTEAEASCQAALAIDPNYVEALAFLGELRADRGRFSEAEELFQRTIAIQPDLASAYFSIATHRKMSREDGDWLKGAEALLERRLPLAQEISLHYALGKYFDDVGQYERAFENYRLANQLAKRQGPVYDRAPLVERVDQIMRSCDPAFLQRSAGQGSNSEQPVFIVGMPRSGTSLAEQILASHPAVVGAGELPFWNGAFSAYRKAEVQGLLDAQLIAELAADYLARLAAESDGGLRVVDKMPANFFYAGLIHAAFPRARIIHMQRHPIDTCLSIYFQHFFGMGPFANDLDDLAHYYGQYLRIMNHWRALLPATALLEVPYEALIENQEGWSRRMVDFIGLPWDPKCLDFHQTDRVVITASKWQVRQKIHSASAGRWKNYEKFVAPLRAALDGASERRRA